MATRGSFFTRGKSSFARTPVPAPAPKPQQMPKAAVAAPAVLTTPPNSYNQSQLAELRKADQSLGNVAKSAYSPADLARIQQEQSKAMLQQPQQPSGLKAVAPANTSIPMETMKAFPQQPKKSVDTQASLVRTPNQQEYLARPAVRKENENASRQLEAAARAMWAQTASAQKMPGVPAPAAQVPQSPSKAMLSYQEAVKAGTAGDMAKPAFKKGGVVKKKPGYAKGGAVAKKTAASKYAKGGMAIPKASNCGASMKPQQRKK